MNNSLASLVKNRRTIHQFRPGECPAASLIEDAIAHAVWAPNHHLSQPWQFHLIGPATAEKICVLNSELVRQKKGERMAEMKLNRWREIPGWLVMSFERDEDDLRRREDYAACCCVAQNLALLLWEQGVGMKWTTGAVTRDPAFFELLGLEQERHDIVGLFWYGYPSEVPAASRRPIADFLESLP